MTHEGKTDDEVGVFLEKVGLEREGGQPSATSDLGPAERRSDAARASDVYRRALARACLSELRHRKAA